MALLWADNFNIYGTTASLMLNGLYAQIGRSFDGAAPVVLIADPDPLASNVYACRFPQPAGASLSTLWTTLRRALDTPKTTIGVAFRLYIDGLPTMDKYGYQIHFRDINNVTQFSLYVLTTGAIAVYRSTPGSGTLLGTTAATAVASQAWNHIEIKGVVDDSAGAVTLHVNGQTVLTITGADTKATAETTVAQIAHLVSMTDFAGGGYSYIKDFIIWDTSGSHNNDFFGTVSVIDIVPDSDTSLGGWAPSTGTTGFNILDNIPPNDTIYIGADTVEAATFGLVNLPSDVTSVRGMMTIARAANIDGGDGKLQVSMVSGVSEDAGADRQITTAFTYWPDICETDPATGLPWTPSGFNAANVKLARTV